MSRSFVLQLLRYGFSGVISVGTYIGLLRIFLHVSPAQELVANALAYCVATAVNYLLNFYWAFSTRRKHVEAAWRYLSVVATGILANALAVSALTSLGLRIDLAALLFAAAWPLASFTFLRLWVMR